MESNLKAERQSKFDVSKIPETKLHNMCSMFLEAIEEFYSKPENMKAFEEYQKKEKKH